MNHQALLAAMVGACPEILKLLPDPPKRTPILYTHADEARIAEAQAKRERKAQKRRQGAKP